MLSYWEQQSFTKYHYAVVGGGLVGLSTALSLKEMDPEASVVLLERGIIPKGASTRNAGFACFGSFTELVADMDNMGAEATRALVSDRWKGLELLRKRIGDKRMGYNNYGGFELLFDKDLHYLPRLEEVNSVLHPVFGREVFSMDNSLAGKFGFSANHVAGIMTNPLEGQLNTGEMMRALIQLAKARGIDYLTGATTESFEISNNQVQLVVSYGPNSMDKVQGVQSKSIPGTETIRLYARRLAVCTNAFANRLIPKLNVTPGRGQVLLTDEIPDLKFKGVFHYDQGYCYFRNIGSRVLFGGARNMDFESETTTEFGPNEQINDYLVHALSEVILPGTKFNVVSRWSGIMGFGEDKRPSIGLHSPEVGYAVRLGGMGVALGSLVGQRLAGLICLNPENS